MSNNIVCHITSAHPRYDVRIFSKECVNLTNSKYNVYLIVADSKGDEYINGVNIIDVGIKKSRFERMLQIPKLIFKEVLQLKPKLVHFHDPELMFIGVKLFKLGYKVVYDVHEDLPKQVLGKYWMPKIIRPVISKLVAYFEKNCAGKLSGIVAATPIIANRFSKYNVNVIVLHNYPMLSESSVSNIRWEDREDKLCYIGSISESRGIKPLVQSLGYSNVTLELAGSFSGDISLSNLKNIPGFEYVNYLGVLDRTKISLLLSKVKIGIVTLLPTPNYLESLPIKLFEYMMAGIPVIASDFKMWRDIVLKYNCGLLVNPYNAVDISNACRLLISNNELAKKLGENGKQAVLKYFNWEQEKIHLIDLYRNLTKP